MKLARLLVVSAVCIALSLGLSVFLWGKMYPEPYDPKNIGYVLWKHGLNKRMDLDAAVAGMTHDAWAVSIVEGLSKDELKARFGYIRSLDEARPYLRLCATMTGTIGQKGIKAGKDVVFLRDDAWMVILENGKAVDLVLCKGY